MRQLKNGDYVNIDVTAYYGGFHGDTSGMAFVGDVHPDILKLVIFNYYIRYKLQENQCSRRFQYANQEKKSEE
jgi:methionine aminopeptidase